MITSLHELLALLHKQKHLNGKRKSWSACHDFPMRNNSLKLSNKMADLLPIRINYWQNGFEIIALHFPHRRLLTIRLALLGSSSNRSLAQTPRITFRSVGAASRLSKGRSGCGKRFQRRNFNHMPPFSYALLGLICHITCNYCDNIRKIEELNEQKYFDPNNAGQVNLRRDFQQLRQPTLHNHSSTLQSLVVTLCTTSPTFCPHAVFRPMCLVWFSEQTAIISLRTQH